MEPKGDEEFYMESWLSKLEGVTIASQMVELTAQELDFIVKANGILMLAYFKELQAHSKKKRSTMQTENEDEVEYYPLGEENWLKRPELSGLLQSYKKAYQGLTNRLNQCLKPNQRYFAKLSLRSAKDSLALKKTQRRYERLLEKLGCPNSHEESFRLGLIIENSDDLLEQLATSQRIVDDIVRHGKSQSKVPLNIIIRPWVLIPHSLEFRAFVHKRQLTAVSAYYRNQLYPFLNPHKKQILDSIVQFFAQNLKHQLPMDSSVLDLGLVLIDSDKLYLNQQEISERLQQREYRVVLIEINPFGKVSGSALFSWLEPVLMNGPLEFRLAHEETFQ